MRLPGPATATEISDSLAAKGILGGVPLARLYPGHDPLQAMMLVATTETVSESDMDAFCAALGEVLP